MRARAPPVAFWANERARVDPKTGVAVLEKPQQDWLRFSRPAGKVEKPSKLPSVKIERTSRLAAFTSFAILPAFSRQTLPEEGAVNDPNAISYLKEISRKRKYYVSA